jgi:tetratricopeptide (TPR) repeat protein
MARPGWVVGLTFLVVGCTETVQERVRVYNEDGVQLYKAGSYAQARETFQAALALKPGDCNLAFNIGQCYEHLGQLDKAEQAYRQCLQLAPEHEECRHALVVLLWQQNRRPETVKLVEDFLARHPKLAAAYAEQGWLWHQLGDLTRAQARLVQALEFDPHNNLALTELAQIYETKNRADRAVYLYEQALTYHPNQPDVINRLTALKAQGAGRPKPD